MKLTRKQFKRIIFEAKLQVGDTSISGQYFDIQYRGKIRGKGAYILVHKLTGYVIPTSMHDYSSTGAKRLLKSLEKQFGPMLENPELHLDFDSLVMIYDFLKNWQYPASEYHTYLD